MTENSTDKNQKEEDKTPTSDINHEHRDNNTNTEHRADEQYDYDAIEEDDDARMETTKTQTQRRQSASGSKPVSASSSSSLSTDARSGAETDSTALSRTAQLATTHTDVELVAAALRPDNTASMTMAVDEEAEILRTTITRETTGGMQSTVDDTIVNLTVADAVVTAVEQCRHTCTDSQSQSQSQTSQTHE